MKSESSVPAWRDIACIAAVCAAFWATTCGQWDLWGPDEGRYVQVAKELLGRDNWFLMTVQGEPYDEKPPLPFWLLAAMLKLEGGGVSSWALRLPSIALGIVAACCTYSIGRSRFGRRAGLFAAAIYVTAPLISRQTPTARLDIMFTGWTTLAAWAYLARSSSEKLPWSRWAVLWLATMGGFFTKGPLAFLFVLAPAVAEAARARSLAPWRMLRPLAGFALSGLLVFGWFYGEAAGAGWEFVRHQVFSQTADRVAEGSHVEPFYFYVIRLFTNEFMPWTLALAASFVWLWRRRAAGWPEGVFPVLAWFVPALAIMTLLPGKRPQYLAPLVPGMAIAVAWFAEVSFAEWFGRRLARPVVALVGAVALAIVAAGLVLYNDVGLLWSRGVYVLPFHAVIVVATGAVGLVALALAWRGANGWRAMGAVVGAMFALEFLAMSVVNPARNYFESSRQLALEVQALLPPGDRLVGVVDEADRPAYHVYGNYDVMRFKGSPKSLLTAAQLPSVMVVREDEREDLADVLEWFDYEDVYTNADPKEFRRLTVYAKSDLLPVRRAGSLAFAFAGDTGTGDDDQRAIAAQVARVDDSAPLSAFFLAGDNMYSNRPFAQAVVKNFDKPWATLLLRRIPFFAVFGNHDFEVPGHREGELADPRFGMKGRDYYRVEYGDEIAFFMLNSETLWHDPTQVAWFRTELVNTNAHWKVAILHRPVVGSEDGHGPSPKLRRLLLGQYGSQREDLDFVIAGHNHIYERMKILRGIQHLTVGSAGALDRDLLVQNPQRVVGYNEHTAFGWMQLEGDHLRWRAVDADGKSIDDVTFVDVEGDMPAGGKHEDAGLRIVASAHP